MTEAWQAISCPDISEAALRGAFDAEELPWSKTLHVTATGALSSAMRDRGLRAVSIRDLINIVVWAGTSQPFRVPVTEYPDLSDDGAFATSYETWSSHVGRSSRDLGVEADECIRETLREVLLGYAPGGRQPTDRERAALLIRGGVRKFRRAIQTVAAAGFYPADIAAAEGDTDLAVALACWERLEVDVADLFRIREDLWVDLAGLAAGTSDDSAVELSKRVEGTLGHLLGVPLGPHHVAYHGFYFFTPPQWALFQLLRHIPETIQTFVVHDDGSSPVFEVWRRYFSGRWDMPVPGRVAAHVSTPATVEGPLREALAGLPVSVGVGGSSPLFRLIGFANSAQFVESRIREERGTPSTLYAADEKSLERVVRRFSGAAGTEEPADLANIPFGQFLLAFHDSISFTPGAAGGAALELRAEPFLRMAATGFLDAGELRPSERIAAMRRAMPYFEGASTTAEWIERAQRLQQLVASPVELYGYRVSPHDGNDVQRMADAAANPLRLVQWCDLSDADTQTLCSGIQIIEDLTKALAEGDGGTVDEYLGLIKAKVGGAFALLDATARNELDMKLGAAGLPGRGVSIEGIVDAVQFILRREPGEVLTDSLDGEVEAEESVTSTAGEQRSVKPLRSLDALAFIPTPKAIHIANLADTKFPVPVTAVPWPFAQHHLRVERHGRLRFSREILTERERSAGLGDMYLLSLAMGGVQPGVELKMSWMQEEGNERRNMSPLLALIAEPGSTAGGGVGMSSLSAAIGGVAIRSGDDEEDAVVVDETTASPCDVESDPRPRERPSEAELSAAINRVHHLAAAAGFACARRFVLQWALGPSGAFQSEHHQQMLYGNLIGALKQSRRVDSTEEAIDLIGDMWLHLTDAQRKSSLKDRAIVPGPAAHWKWIYTLAGEKEAVPTDPLSEAYNAARRGWRPSGEVLAPDNLVLPAAPPRPANPWNPIPCRACPVRPRCAVALDDD